MWKEPTGPSGWQPPRSGVVVTLESFVSCQSECDQPDPHSSFSTSPSTVTTSEREVARVTTGATGKLSSYKNLPQMHKGEEHDTILIVSFLISFIPKKSLARLRRPLGVFCTNIHVASECSRFAVESISYMHCSWLLAVVRYPFLHLDSDSFL